MNRRLLLLPIASLACFPWVELPLAQEAPPSPKPILETALLDYDVDLPIARAEIHGHSVRLILDTGASNLFLFQDGFDQLELSSLPEMQIDAVGGDGKANVVQFDTIEIRFGENVIKPNKIFVMPSRETGLWNEDKPFIEGVMPLPTVKRAQKVLPVVFDPAQGKMMVMNQAAIASEVNSAHLPLFRDRGWRLSTRLKVLISGYSDPMELNLLIDTGFAGALSINIEKFPEAELIPDSESTVGGIGGSELRYALARSKVFIGDQLILVETHAENSNHISDSVDGMIGWKFLKRFHTTFDFAIGELILRLDGADLSPDKAYRKRTAAGGVPLGDWSGLYVKDVGNWGDDGLEVGDIVRSVDGTEVGPTTMYTVIRAADETSSVCWNKTKGSEGELVCKRKEN